MKAFEISGGNGTVLQLKDGRFADTVIGDTSEQIDAADTHHAYIGWLKFTATQKGIYAIAAGAWSDDGAGKWYVEYYYNLDESA